MTSQPGAQVYTQGFGTSDISVAFPVYLDSAPSSSYGVNFPIGKRAIVESTDAEYVLTSKSTSGGVTTVTWTLAGSPTGAVSTLSGDSGTATPVAGDIGILGTASEISTAGAGSNITISLPAAITTPGSLTTTTTLASTTTVTGGTGVIATTGGVTATAGGVTATAGDITATAGNFVLTAEGGKVNHTSVATTTAAGANAIGSVTLVSGTATVSTTSVTSSSLIKIWRQSIGSTGAAATGNLTVGTIVDGTSFVITATQAADATAAQTTDVSVVGWEIVN